MRPVTYALNLYRDADYRRTVRLLDKDGEPISTVGARSRLQVRCDPDDPVVLLDASDAAIARSIIALAGSLGLSVIAEGVETTAHHQFLLAHGCQAFQGYLFGRPLTLEDFENRVRQGV